MRTLFAAAGSAVALAAAVPASAASVVQDYAFEAVADGPVTHHAGTFSVTYDTVADSYALLSFAYVLGGHLLDASNTSMADWGHPQYLIGGDLSGINTVNTGVAEPDFFFRVDFDTLAGSGFVYSLGDSEFHFGELTISRVDGAVPEPATWALLLLGFGAAGGAMRAQRRPARVQVG